MSVRQSLLAILDQGPCYGYQLRTEFARRTGSTSTLNVGQIYNTLDRLERDGLVAKDDVDEHGHVYWRITDAGAAVAREWFASPVVRAEGTRDELAVKIAIAATLPGVDAEEIVATQLASSRAALDRLRADLPADARGPEALAHALVQDALIAAAEADVAWLERTAARLAQHPDRALSLALATERPRRGRPVRADG